MANSILSESQALALLVFYFGSVGVPILIYLMMQLSKLAELHRECRSIVSFLRRAKPKGDLGDYCAHRSYDCDAMIHEKNRQAKIAIVAVMFGGFYLALGLSSGGVSFNDALAYLLLATVFPLAVLWAVHTSIDSFTGAVGEMRGFLQVNYGIGNGESSCVEKEHRRPEAEQRRQGIQQERGCQKP